MKYRLLAAMLCLFLHVHAQENKGPVLTIQQNLQLAAEKRTAGDTKEATRYLNEAAIIAWEAKNYDDAIKYFNESIGLNIYIKNLSGVAKLNSNLGMIYSDKSEYERSLTYFKRALDYREKFGEKSERISTKVNIAVVLNNLKRYPEAIEYLEQALALATEMNDAAQMKSCYGMLSETYEKAGNQEKMLHYFNLYRTFHEMIQRNKVNEANKETESAKMQALIADLARKEKEIAVINATRELKVSEEDLKRMDGEVRELIETKTKQELAIKYLESEVNLEKLKLDEAKTNNDHQRILLWGIIAGSLGLIFFVILMYRNYLFKKNANRRLSDQNEEIRALNENLELQVENRTSELRKTLSNLEIRNLDLDQFSHIISHNLRGPVASILGLGNILNKNNPSDPINVEVFERLLFATRNLDDVVTDLSKIIEVRDSPGTATENVKLKEVCSRVMSMLQEDIERSKAQIKIDVTEAPVVKTVGPYIESVLFNLVSNAIKYKSPLRDPVIEIRSYFDSTKSIITVKDNGVGIDKDDLEKIFMPYKRLHIDGEGRGLGLYMAKTQMGVMGGTIEVISEKTKGSLFTIGLQKN